MALVSAPIVSRNKRISKQCEAERIPTQRTRCLRARFAGGRITAHEYPPTRWAVGEVVQETAQISAAKLQPDSYAVWMGMYAPVTKMRAAVEAGHDRSLHDVGIDAEPIPDPEFDQTLGW